MLFLNEAMTFELDHRAYNLRGIPSPPLLVAAAKGGTPLALSVHTCLYPARSPPSLLTIEDHEPRPIEEYDPRVAGDDDKSLCSDITCFKRVGDYLIVVHPLRRPIEPGPDRMLCFRVGYVLERYAA